jgi:hypothetical protein
VNPQYQTYEMALKAVKTDGENLRWVRKDLIDENIIVVAIEMIKKQSKCE